MPTGPCVLAVDLGTSGPKAAVVSAAGRIVATARAHVATLFLPDNGAEQDPAAIWAAVKIACKTVIQLASVTPDEVLAVICSSQYSSIVPVDAEGQPTMNMILWMDGRGGAARLRKLPKYPWFADTPLQLLQWLRIHGLPPVAAGLSLNHMRFIKYARPEVYARTATFLEPMDYVTLCFTGRPTANQCTASMMLLTDNRELDVTRYHPRLLRYAGIDAAKLPELLHLDAVAGTVRPEVASELGLSPATRVITGVNDTQAGGLATAAFGGRHAAISIGSTSVMITHVDRKRTDAIHAIFSMPSPVPRTWFVMAENGTGGATLEHFLENLIHREEPATGPAVAERFAILQRAVDETPPGSGGVLFLPWMSGSIAPAADAHVRGGFLNLGLKTTRSHMARAVLEGVAMNLRWLRRPVERFARRQFSHFVFYGGAAESDAWAQILADVLQAPVHQVENPQYLTCLGVGLLALERLGLVGFDEFQRLSPIRRIYQPRAETRAVYDAMFVQFVRAFRQNRSIFRALNRNQEQT